MNDENRKETVAEETIETVDQENTDTTETNTEEAEETSAGQEETGTDESSGEPGEKGIFREEKRKERSKISRSEDLTDRVRRTMAEFDNFRKRTEKEKSAMYEIGARDIVERILPVIDNFERGLEPFRKRQKEVRLQKGWR